jgi:hypothetical protein
VPQEQLVVKAKGQQRKVDDRKDRKPQRPHSPQKVPKRSSLPLKNSYRASLNPDSILLNPDYHIVLPAVIKKGSKK